MILLELFDEKYSYKEIEPSEAHGIAYSFEAAPLKGSEEKSVIEVTFLPEIEDEEGVWSVEFHRDGDYGLTNSGDQFKIFSTVLDITLLFTQDHKPKYLSWSAKKAESSRVSLYSKLASKIRGYENITKTYEETASKAAVRWFSNRLKHATEQQWTLLKRK